MLDAFLTHSLKLPGTTLEQNENGSILEFYHEDGAGPCKIFHLFPGISLIYLNVDSYSWPVPSMKRNTGRHSPLMIQFCTEGRCKITNAGGASIYLNNGEVAIMKQFFGNRYDYPKGVYEGIDILMDLEQLPPASDYLHREFGLDLHRLAQLYCPQDSPYSAPCVSELKRLLKLMRDLPEEESPHNLFRMKICAMALLEFLLYGPYTPAARQGSFLTEGQIAIAQETERIISQDLSRRYTARELAERFSVSESSLKNYFRSVYGKNFSTYTNEARMQRGALLLTTTDLSVTEIAAQVSYARQSKFTEAFKKQYGVTPLEYRRLNVVR